MGTAFIITLIALYLFISYERPIKMTATNLNYTTIKATLDTFASLEAQHKMPIALLLEQGHTTQREIELQADELMIESGFFTRKPFRLDEGQFNQLVWFYFSQLQHLSPSEQSQTIHKIADLS